MDQRLEMSLDAIIKSKNDKGSGRGGPARRSAAGRSQRVQSSAPYESKTEASSGRSSRGIISVKFLARNDLAGSLIGSGGSCITDLIDISEARVNVSTIENTFPGTDERFVTITGPLKAVSYAQALVWECIALQARDQRTWNPRAVAQSMKYNKSDVDCSGKITIPAAAAGSIIGRAGSVIKQLSDASGATIQINDKSEVDDELQERVVSINGGKSKCAEAVSLILKKLFEEGEDVYKYSQNVHADSYGDHRDSGRSETSHSNIRSHTSNSNSSNSNRISSRRIAISHAPQRSSSGGAGGRDRDSNHNSLRGSGVAAAGGGGGSSRGNRDDDKERRGGRGGGGGGGGSLRDSASSSLRSAGASLLSAETTMTVAVPDDIVGNIFGKQGATLNEIMNKSGAKIVVSNRGEFIPGTSNRLVTITGSPASAQAAQKLIAQKLRE